MRNGWAVEAQAASTGTAVQGPAVLVANSRRNAAEAEIFPSLDIWMRNRIFWLACTPEIAPPAAIRPVRPKSRPSLSDADRNPFRSRPGELEWWTPTSAAPSGRFRPGKCLREVAFGHGSDNVARQASPSPPFRLKFAF